MPLVSLRCALFPLPGLLGLVGLLTGTGCFDAAIADVTSLSCASNADCPEGSLCRVQLGRCIAAADLDDEAPAFTVTRLAPAVARAGDRIELSFVVSEALGLPPRVTSFGASPFREDAVDGLTYTFSSLVTDDDVEGPRSVVVELVDTDGNAVSATAGVVRIDRTGPVVDLESVEILPAQSAPGATVSVRVVASEPVVAPVLRVGSGADAEAVAGESSALGVLAFTFAAPALSGSYLLQLDPPVDDAGNVGDDAVLGSLIVDGESPVLLAVQPSATHLSRQPLARVLRVTVEVDDDDATVDLEVGGEAGLCDRLADAGAAFECAFFLCDDVDCTPRLADGSHLAVVAAVDGVGQRAVRTFPIVVDTVAPVVDGFSAPTPVRAGALIEVELSLSEPPCLPPTLQLVGTETLTFAGQADAAGGVRWAFPAPAGDADATLAVSGVADCGGNDVVVTPLPLRIDGTAPVIAGLPVSFGRLGDAPLSFAVSLAGADRDDDEVVVTASIDGRDEVVCPLGADGQRTCLVATASSPEGGTAVVVSARDVVGNVVTERRGLTLDRRAPDVVPGGAFLLLTPPPGSGLQVASRATVGTRVLIGVALDEASATPPVLRERTLGLGVASETAAGTFYRFSFTVTAPAPTPVHLATLELEVEDDVGNVAVREVALPEPLIVDTEAPAAPEAAAFELVREPLGSRATALPRFRVEVAPDAALEAGATLVALDEGALLELGRITLDDAPRARTIELPSPDRTRVAVQLIDDAGNRSPITVVTRGRVIASPRDDLGEEVNPHRVLALGSALTLAAPGAGPPVERATLTVDDDVTTVVRAAAEWDVRDTEMPPAVRLATLFADPARGAVYMVGGFAGADQERTWRFTRHWTPITPADPEEDGNLPKGRRFLRAYDASRDVVVFTGGDDFNNNRFTDVWEWNGRSYKKITLTDPEGDGNPPAASSTPSFQHALGYDSARGDVILYQQATQGQPATWRFRGTSWEKLLPEDPEGDGNPDLPTHATMAFDPVRAVLLLRGDACRQSGGSFGCGGTTAGVVNEQQWAWNGRSWRKDPLPLPDGVTTPAARGTTLVTDRNRGRVLLVGSQPFAGGAFTVFEWDGTTWTRRLSVPTTEAAPHGLAFTSVAFDAARDHVVMYGRSNDTNTYLWSDARGLEVLPSHDPEADGDVHLRFGGTAGGGDIGGRGIVFGGFNATGTTTGFHDPWRFTGASWTRLPLGPFPTDGGAVAHDTARDVIVVFGGTSSSGTLTNTLIEVSATNVITTPTPLDPEGDGDPGPRMYVSAGFDPLRSRTVFVGGSGEDGGDLDEVWEWTGSSFVRAIVEDPEGDGSPTRLGATRLVWSDAEQALILFGGTSLVEDVQNSTTWAWDGVSFRQVDDDSPFTSLLGAAGSLANGDIVVVGGFVDFARPAAGLSRFRGGRWEPIPVVDALGDGDLPTLEQPMAFFDRERGRFVGFGTRQAPGVNGARTGHTAQLDPSAIGPPVLAMIADRDVLPADAALGTVVVRGRAGGDGGVDVVVWDVDGWRQRRPAGPGTTDVPDAVEVTVAIDERAPIAVGLTPRQGERLTVDSVELELRYERRP